MARPIKDTPVLSGKAAKRFSEQIKKNENKKISAAKYKKAVDKYKQIMEKAQL